MSLLSQIEFKCRAGETVVAVLIDPDDVPHIDSLTDTVRRAEAAGADCFFAGGSLITGASDIDLVKALKEISSLPVAVFPSSPAQIHPDADALLFLSLISGRNPEYLIGHHVTAAPLLRKSGTEVIPVGYMLVDSGSATTASYISHTAPLPRNKPEIAASTALAGEMLGLRMLYLDAGSGADRPVTPEMVSAVKSWTTVPLAVGGGIRRADEARMLIEAGADVIVTGNGSRDNPQLLKDLCALKKV